MNDDARERRRILAELQLALQIANQALDELDARLPGNNLRSPDPSYEETRLVDRIAVAISKSIAGNE